MKQAIIGGFKSQKQAELALQEISFDNLASEEISIIKLNTKKQHTQNTSPFNDLQGFVIQGANYEIADLGEAFVAGPLESRLKNNTAQNLQGALLTYGVTPDNVSQYEEMLRSGKTLLIIETNSSKASQVANLMSEYGGKSVSKWNKNLNHDLKVYKSP